MSESITVPVDKVTFLVELEEAGKYPTRSELLAAMQQLMDERCAGKKIAGAVKVKVGQVGDPLEGHKAVYVSAWVVPAESGLTRQDVNKVDALMADGFYQLLVPDLTNKQE